MIDLPARIRKLRKFIGYSQEAVAHELCMTQPAYNKLENGKTQLTIQRLEQLTDFYAIAISDLMNKNPSELRLMLLNNEKFKDTWEG